MQASLVGEKDKERETDRVSLASLDQDQMVT